ncbi:CRISPR-associated protein Csx3 [Desulfurobacterium pacificum]|uniref:CRISPR-associated protein Csx3 n=1 Tax=Desulfurobacterium pacificum TaxID=240166 RepID=A0ABY1NB79_9BACT|nr:CRISPR-associated ring nuclease Crn3/Csx3 [Desulfurobacterium pacificum]SMP05169.1 CRISPR-associated protein Csx3 [Desulfurobacterium pacificum]
MIRFSKKEILNGEAVLVEFEIEDGVTTPKEAFSVELPPVPYGKGVILSGRGPIWFYGRLIHHFHPAKWVAVFDPRIGAVVVQSHTKEIREGDVIEFMEK